MKNLFGFDRFQRVPMPTGDYFFHAANPVDIDTDFDVSGLVNKESYVDIRNTLEMLRSGRLPGSLDLRGRTPAEYIAHLEAILENE